ncbi:MAG: hypothetical protein JW881_03855 [Spirochaetales bacterium]|nr:hypothetical protein [Spirochaetales bacterium]
MKKCLCGFIVLHLLSLYCYSQNSWILPIDSECYKRAEELFINSWYVPPLDETPVIAGDLILNLNQLAEKRGNSFIKSEIDAITAGITLPVFGFFTPIVETAFCAAFDSEPGRLREIDTNDNKSMTARVVDFTYFYDIESIPSFLTIGFIAQGGGFSILFEPELRSSHTYMLEYDYLLNVPLDIVRIDQNIPYRGIAAYYHPPFEARFGRDKLKIGPGKWSTLTLHQLVPYYNYLKVRFFWDWFSFSFYLLQLNPTISKDESVYLDDLYTSGSNPEYNAGANGKAYVDRSKYYALARLSITPFPWLSLSVMQTNLIAGRTPLFSDFNPFSVYHNTYAEGVYSVPFNASLTVVPYRGVKLYADYLFYDAVLGDEIERADNPMAAAYQAGFSLLSQPFFNLGPGRFRLDGEFALVDPWVYGKYYNLRKFTTRIIYVESYHGRYWVDFPLGFYLGPDVVDINLALAYGVPGKWEAELHWNRNGKGEIDLYGWDDGNDYSYIGEDGYPLTGAPTGTAQWTENFSVSIYYELFKNVTIGGWYRLRVVENRFNESGDGGIYHYTGIQGTWKFY